MTDKLILLIEEEFSKLEDTKKNNKLKEKLRQEAIENFAELREIGYSETEAYERTVKKLTEYQSGYVNIYTIKNNIPNFSKYDLIPISLIILAAILAYNAHKLTFIVDNIFITYALLALNLIFILSPIVFDKKHRLATSIVSFIILALFLRGYFYNPMFINNLPTTTIWMGVFSIIYYLQVKMPMKSIFGFLKNKR